jgi:hypothetical protein
MARLFIKDASVKFVIPPGPFSGATEYNCSVKTAELVTTPGKVVEYATLCDKIQQQGASTYAIHLVGVQDWATGGLSLFLWSNAGSAARVVINAYGKTAAYAAATPGIDATVTLVEGKYGGESQTWAEFEVELPCTARPTLASTTPTGLSEEQETSLEAREELNPVEKGSKKAA